MEAEELIARLVELKEPSGEVDNAIAHLDWAPKAHPGSEFEYRVDRDGTAQWRVRHPPHDWGSWWTTPPSTRSVDAAIDLVPGGCEWLVRTAGKGRCFARVTRDFVAIIEVSGDREVDQSTGDIWRADAATPAIALAIAALRARVATEGRG